MDKASQGTHFDVCDQALEHYEALASECSHWNSVIPKAIDFYKQHGAKKETKMTIKEKARVAWERDLEVTVITGDPPDSFSGKISKHNYDGGIRVVDTDLGAKWIAYKNIAEIRFADKDMPLSQRIQDAKEHGYRVRIDYGALGGVSHGRIVPDGDGRHMLFSETRHFDHQVRDVRRVKDETP